MPPSYQPPSVESVLDAGRSVVGEPPEQSVDVASDHHHMPSSSEAAETPASTDAPSGHPKPKHDPTTSSSHGVDDEAPYEAHDEPDSTAVVLSSSPVIAEPNDEPSSGYDRVPQELRNGYGGLYRAPSPSGISALSGFSATTNRSAGSSGSGSTVTRRAHAASGRGGGERHRNGERPQQPDPIPEHYHGDTTPRPPQVPWFEPNSPDAGPHYQQRPMPRSFEQQQQQPRGWKLANAPGHRHATTRSVSSATSSLSSDPFSDRSLGHATDGSLSSPDRSEPADSPESRYAQQMACSTAFVAPGTVAQQRDPFMYMMPPPPPLPQQQQQQLSPAFHEHFQHPTRPDHLPETGYEQLASRLSVSDSGPPAIQPMYRRFEALNHRLLLHLQDQLMELEEQLHQLDAADTQSRRAHNGGFHPASRRQEAMAAGDLHFYKTDVLGKIGFTLNQYSEFLLVLLSAIIHTYLVCADQVLSSFKETQSLQSPRPADIDSFKDYLLSHNPVVENESRFLDAEEDLVSLSRPGAVHDFNGDNLLTPMPRRAIAFPPTPTSPLSDVGSRVSAQRSRNRPVPRKRDEPKPLGVLPLLAGGMAAAFFLPIMAFLVIPSFVGRLAVVFFMTAATGVALLQTGVLRHLNGAGPDDGGATNAVVCAGVYGAVMAMLAVLL